jgi:hypothetical protein
MPPLPFDRTGELVEQGGDVVVSELPCAVWRLPGPRQTQSGETYDWTGEAAEAFAAELAEPNRTIVVDGAKLKIVSVATHAFFPHVELRLREMLAGG